MNYTGIPGVQPRTAAEVRPIKGKMVKILLPEANQVKGNSSLYPGIGNVEKPDGKAKVTTSFEIQSTFI